MRIIFTRKTIWILTPYIVALATFLAQGKAFEYHSAPWQICIIMSVAIWLAAMSQKSPNHKHLVYALTIVIVGIIFARALSFSQYADTMATWLKINSRVEYLRSSYKMINPDNGRPSPLVSEQISEWIRQNSEADDKILVWGLECQLYALSKRMYATNSPFDFILTGDFKSNEKASAWQDSLRKQFMRRLNEDKPKYIIITSHDTNPIEPLPSNESVTLVPGFALFIEKEYNVISKVFPFEIYQRKF